MSKRRKRTTHRERNRDVIVIVEDASTGEVFSTLKSRLRATGGRAELEHELSAIRVHKDQSK